MELKDIVNKFIENPSDMGMGSGKMAKRWKTTPEKVQEAREIVRNILASSASDIDIDSYDNSEVRISRETSIETGEGKLEAQLITEPKSVDELYEVFKIDKNAYRISKYWTGFKTGKWNTTVEIKANSVGTDLNLQKQIILDELKKAFPTKKLITKDRQTKGNQLLELSLFDMHFGKMSHADETGDDFDMKIACKRFTKAVNELLSRVDLTKVGRILFPVGNDMFNIDNIQKTTTAGTPQDNDTRYHEMIKVVKNLLIKTIVELSEIAPVDVVVVSGNHDYQTTFLFGEILDAYFHNDKNVNVNNSPKLRKYYSYGNTAIQFTHGDNEKHQDLGLIFATEQPKIWSSSKFRYCQMGHLHKSKKIDYVSVDEHQGFKIQILPSLSSTDAWHYKKGYNSMKAAKAFLIDKKEGIIGEFTYTV